MITPFCTELTGISQEMLSGAPAFPDVMEALRQAMLIGRWGVVWGSWGLFDDTLEGAQHRALADAKNISRMLPWVVGVERSS